MINYHLVSDNKVEQITELVCEIKNPDEDAKKLIEEATTAMQYGVAAKVLGHPFLSKQNETTKATHLKSKTWRTRYQTNNG